MSLRLRGMARARSVPQHAGLPPTTALRAGLRRGPRSESGSLMADDAHRGDPPVTPAVARVTEPLVRCLRADPEGLPDASPRPALLQGVDDGQALELVEEGP